MGGGIPTNKKVYKYQKWKKSYQFISYQLYKDYNQSVHIQQAKSSVWVLNHNVRQEKI